jgi:aspartyl/asparaginyl beta-hydroxylase (cupin superfamily)
LIANPEGDTPLPAPFYSGEDFPWTTWFLTQFQDVEREMMALSRGMTPLHSRMTPFRARYTEIASGMPLEDARWFSRTFIFFTIKNSIVLSAAPTISTLLAKVPDIVSAVLLRLDGGVHLQPHRGYTPDALRCHLGISVPEPGKCILRVANERRAWSQGEWLIFDDYQEHEAWHYGTRPRLVLMIDVVRPGSEFSPKEVAERFFSGMPGMHLDSELEGLADLPTWRTWVAAGEFPTL